MVQDGSQSSLNKEAPCSEARLVEERTSLGNPELQVVGETAPRLVALSNTHGSSGLLKIQNSNVLTTPPQGQRKTCELRVKLQPKSVSRVSEKAEAKGTSPVPAEKEAQYIRFMNLSVKSVSEDL